MIKLKLRENQLYIVCDLCVLCLHSVPSSSPSATLPWSPLGEKLPNVSARENHPVPSHPEKEALAFSLTESQDACILDGRTDKEGVGLISTHQGGPDGHSPHPACVQGERAASLLLF